MISVQSLFEVHLPVADLDRAITFYRDVVGLRLAHLEPARQAAFFWIGPAGNAMLGLWGAGSAPQKVTSHTAFRVSVADVISVPAALRSAGVTPLDFDGRPTDEPLVFAWMPAASVFFRDPDGHLLEFIAMLPQKARPEDGIVPWRKWQQAHRLTSSELVITSDPTPDQVQYLEDRIYDYNAGATGITDGEWLAMFVEDDNGRIVAGICGNTWGGCLEIRQFWVEEPRRKQGLGTRLLLAAEGEARRRGCRQILLMTFTFQAPAFYARHGFEVIAAVDDHPRGHTNLLMRKRLGESS